MRQLKRDSLNEWLIIRSQQGESDAFTALVQNWQQIQKLELMREIKRLEMRIMLVADKGKTEK